MKKLNLRCVDAAAATLQRSAAAWRKCGMAIRYREGREDGEGNAPNPLARYIAFRADHDPGGWDGLICADEWLSHAAPALAALAPAQADAWRDHATQLFAATPRPLSPILPISRKAECADAFAYTGIQVTGSVEGRQLQNAPLAALATPEGTIWLRALPPAPQADVTAPSIPAWVGDLPVTLQFILGNSRLSQGCLARIGLGDVLLVSDHALRIRCRDLVLGWYSINEEGINVDELLEEPYGEAADAAEYASEFASESASEYASEQHAHRRGGSLNAAAMARIPVRLEFVLQQHTVTIGGLGQLHAGQVIGLAPAAEKEVLILANGVAVGRGELVQLEDRLGVEMSDIYGGEGGESDENHAD